MKWNANNEFLLCSHKRIYSHTHTHTNRFISLCMCTYGPLYCGNAWRMCLKMRIYCPFHFLWRHYFLAHYFMLSDNIQTNTRISTRIHSQYSFWCYINVHSHTPKYRCGHQPFLRANALFTYTYTHTNTHPYTHTST